MPFIYGQRFWRGTILLDEIPTNETDASSWLIKTFHLKDELLSDFTTYGYFPHQGAEVELSTIKCAKFCRRCYCNRLQYIPYSFLTFLQNVRYFKLFLSRQCCSAEILAIPNFRGSIRFQKEVYLIFIQSILILLVLIKKINF